MDKNNIVNLAMTKELTSIKDVREKVEVVVNLITDATKEMIKDFNRFGGPKMMILTKNKLAYADVSSMPDTPEERSEFFKTLGKNLPQMMGDDCYAFVFSAEAFAEKVDAKTGTRTGKKNCIHISAIDIEGFEFQKIIPFNNYKVESNDEFKEIEGWHNTMKENLYKSPCKELLVAYKFALFSKGMNAMLGRKDE